MSRPAPGTAWFGAVRLQFGTNAASGYRYPTALRRAAGAWPPRVRLIVGVALAVPWCLGQLAGLRLVYNATESEPRGWYLTRPARPPLSRGQLIVFPVPVHVAGLVAERRWLPPGVPLLKRVAAVAGDVVCVDTTLRIRGEVIGPVLSVDAAGRPLPVPASPMRWGRATQGHDSARVRAARLMRADALVARRRRRYRVTTQSHHPHPIAPNVLARRFAVTAPTGCGSATSRTCRRAGGGCTWRSCSTSARDA